MRVMPLVALLVTLSACGSGGTYTQEEVDALIEKAVADALQAEPEAPSTTETPTTTSTTRATTTTTRPTTTTFVLPSLSEFEVELVIVNKECFGSAGCNVTFQPVLYYDGPDIPDDVEYRLVYEVRGGEDGTLVFYLDLEGTMYSWNDEHIQIARSSDELTVEVVRVLER